MYERTYGYRYAELGDHPTAAQVAKTMRRDIHQAIAEGLLPSHWTYSVRSDTFAGGCSVDVTVQDCPDAWEQCDGGSKCRDVWCSARNDPTYAHAAKPHDVLTNDAEAASMTLGRIHNAYNHNGSEIQVDYFDVRYYGTVTFEDAGSAEFRQREKQRLAARKTARETGQLVGRVANYKRDGSRVTHLLIQTDDGKQVLGCGARIWRHSLISKVSDDHELTCSRCAAKAGNA